MVKSPLHGIGKKIRPSQWHFVSMPSTYWIYEEAERKLTLWDEEFPDIYAYLNPESVAWWRDRLTGKVGPLFSFGSHSIWHFFGASFVASFITIGISSVTGIFEPKSTCLPVFHLDFDSGLVSMV